jgi:hypothetical protein
MAAARELMIYDHGEVRRDSSVSLSLLGRREVIGGAENGNWALDTLRALHPEEGPTGRPAPMMAKANGIHVRVGRLGKRIRLGASYDGACSEPEEASRPPWPSPEARAGVALGRTLEVEISPDKGYRICGRTPT